MQSHEPDAADLPQADATVRARTGRGWQEWFALLDAERAAELPHGEIARLLSSRAPEVSGWWVQTLVVGYERARGLRDRHQTPSGYQFSTSRTLPVPVATLYAAWADPALRAGWLPGEPLAVTRATAPRSIRGRWTDGSRLEALFHPKGDARSQVSVSQTRLAEAGAVARQKAFWKERLDALRGLLEADAEAPQDGRAPRTDP